MTSRKREQSRIVIAYTHSRESRFLYESDYKWGASTYFPVANPKIGLSMLYCLGEPFREMIKCISRASTNYIELVDDGFHELTRPRVLALNDVKASCKIQYSVHAPFADINIASASKPLQKAMVKRMTTSIAFARELDARVWVFHPGLRTGISSFYPDMGWLQNLKTARSLARTAHDYGVSIAIENVPELFPFLIKGVEDFRKFFAEVDESIGLALDVGHSNLNGQTELFLKIFGDRIIHVHAHDNHGKSDEHLGVGYGSVDWDRFGALIKSMSYEGVIVVESVEQVKESMEKLRQLLTC